MSDTAPQGEAPAGSNITSEPTDASEALPDEHPGVEDGTVLKTEVPSDEPNQKPTVIEEKVVYDFDTDGKQIGWHKEAVTA